MKFGLILLVLVFGALMLVLGLATPPSIKAGVADFVAQAVGRAKPVASTASRARSLPTASASAALTGSRASTAASGGAGKGAAPAGAQPAAKPVAASAILLPADLPAKGQYALQLGRFADAASAESAAAVLAPLHVQWRVISLLDQWGGQSAVLAVGPYASIAEARAAQPQLDTVLHGSAALPVILLPATPG